MRFTGKKHGSTGDADSWSGTDHSYLRLHPDVGREVYGPKSGEEPAVSGQRHEVLRSFAETDILPFGGLLQEVTATEGTVTPVTLIPHFPAYPPETSWMRTPRTKIPALVLRESEKGGRVAYLAADLDRRYSRDNLPDHGDLLAKPGSLDGKGQNSPASGGAWVLIDCHLYRQENRLILHIVNLTGAGTWRSPVDELIPVGPLRESRLRPPEGFRVGAARLLVGEKAATIERGQGQVTLTIASVLDHEVVVFE